MKIKIRIKDSQRKIPINKKKVAELANQVLKIKGKREAELSILFAGRQRIRTLNKKFRRIDRPTDVLAFSQKAEGKDAGLHPEILGDVVICPQIARGEIYLCLVHGILHLLGYGDSNAKQRSLMEKEQARILRRLARR